MASVHAASFRLAVDALCFVALSKNGGLEFAGPQSDLGRDKKRCASAGPEMTRSGEGIAASAIAGVGWNYFGGVLSSACSLVAGIVLARMLGPKPYGQIIVASTIYGFLNLFVDGGFSLALIQKPTLDSQTIRRTFTCQVCLGIAMTLVVFVFAPWIAGLFHTVSATPVVQVMSLAIVIQSAGLVSSALLRKQMRFNAIQRSAVASSLIGYLMVSIPLALLGSGVWSLVAGSLSQCLLNTIFLYCAARHILRPSFGLPERAVTKFGSTIVASNLVNWGHANLDNLAASGLGPIALGLYGRACNFAYQPVHAVVPGLQAVLLSSAAKAQERRLLIGEVALCSITIVFGILGPAYVTFAMIPQTTIVGLFGEKWTGVLPLVVPLALAMPFYAAHCLLGPIVCGLGRPELEFWPQAASCLAAGIAFFIAARESLAALAWTLFGVMLFRFAVTGGFAFHLLRIRWAKVLREIAGRAAFSAAFGVLAWLTDEFLRRSLHMVAGPRLAVVAVFCAVLLGATIWSAGEVVLGHEAIVFLLRYASNLPQSYARQLRAQARRGGHLPVIEERIVSSSAEAAG